MEKVALKARASRAVNTRKRSLFTMDAICVPAYTVSAIIYDHMMREVDYKAWCKYILLLMKMAGNRFQSSKLRGKKLCELGCGTGNLSLLLAQAGFDVTGVDSSVNMLDVARGKKIRAGTSRPLFVNHDMTSYRSSEAFEAAVCVYDSLNYLPTRSALKSFFSNVYSNLKPGGVLVFDASLESNSLGEAATFKQRGKYKSMVYERQSSYNSSEKIHTTYVRVAVGSSISEEVHREYVYTLGTLRRLFNQAGFVERFAASDFTMIEADENSERVHFVLVRPDHD